MWIQSSQHVFSLRTGVEKPQPKEKHSKDNKASVVAAKTPNRAHHRSHHPSHVEVSLWVPHDLGQEDMSSLIDWRSLTFFFWGGGGLRIEKPAHQPKWLFEGIFSDGSMSSGSSWNRYSFPLPERSWAWVLNTYICIHEKCINTSIIQRQRHRQRQISGLTKKTFFTVTKVHIFVHVYVFVYCLRQT